MVDEEAAVPTAVDPSRLWYTALHHLLDEVVFIHREDRTIAFVSPSVERVLGYTPEQFTALRTPELIHPDDLPAAIELALQLRADPGASYRSTLRLKRADGAWIWVEIVGQNMLEEPEVRGVVQTLRDVSQQRELEEQLLHQSRHDALTGLANRRFFIETLESALGATPALPVCVVYVDLDGFKPVNDDLGHAAGDELLRIVAGRIRDGLRARDLAARFGGDEFVALCYGVGSTEEAERTAARVHDALTGPADLGIATVDIAASVGVALAVPDDSVDHLIARADAALYEAKSAGKGRVAVHDPTR